MKVLVIGSGGRCHAIVDALAKSPEVEKIYCAPGNAGIAAEAQCVAIADTDAEALADFAERLLESLPDEVELYSLRLHETASSFAEWFAEDNF